MRLKLDKRCEDCAVLLTTSHQSRGLCDGCWQKTSTQERADFIAGKLRTELGNFSPLLRSIMTVHPEKKIARIKEIRSHTGLNLKHAKSVADQVNIEIPSFANQESMKEVRALRDEKWQDKEKIRDLESQVSHLEEVTASAAQNVEELRRLRHLSQNLEARLGATQRDNNELLQRYANFDSLMEDAIKVLEVLDDRVQDDKTSPVVRGLVTALDALVREALEPHQPDTVPF
jgi:chromosome segregation ATPase